MPLKKIKNLDLALQEVLCQQLTLLTTISTQDYQKPIDTLNQASIGEHTRHLIEFLEILLSGYKKGVIDYDARTRNPETETLPEVAIQKIKKILTEFQLENKSLLLVHQTSFGACTIETNFHRELLYNIEHCIHHQALVKVALNELKLEKNISDTFGVASSTIFYRELQNK